MVEFISDIIQLLDELDRVETIYTLNNLKTYKLIAYRMNDKLIRIDLKEIF